MKKVSIFLADGFEEVEALTPTDLLRRAGAEVTLVSTGDKKEVAGSNGIVITADHLFAEMDFTEMDLLVLPGGMPGTLNLKACEPLLELLKEHHAKGRRLAAICAAPTVLGHAGLLNGKKATCYPGCEYGLSEPSARPPRSLPTASSPPAAASAPLSLRLSLIASSTTGEGGRDREEYRVRSVRRRTGFKKLPAYPLSRRATLPSWR